MKISKDLKRRLLVAITVGELDFDKFPELVDACRDHSKIKPMTKAEAKSIIKALEDE